MPRSASSAANVDSSDARSQEAPDVEAEGFVEDIPSTSTSAPTLRKSPRKRGKPNPTAEELEESNVPAQSGSHPSKKRKVPRAPDLSLDVDHGPLILAGVEDHLAGLDDRIEALGDRMMTPLLKVGERFVDVLAQVARSAGADLPAEGDSASNPRITTSTSVHRVGNTVTTVTTTIKVDVQVDNEGAAVVSESIADVVAGESGEQGAGTAGGEGKGKGREE